MVKPTDSFCFVFEGLSFPFSNCRPASVLENSRLLLHVKPQQLIYKFSTSQEVTASSISNTSRHIFEFGAGTAESVYRLSYGLEGPEFEFQQEQRFFFPPERPDWP
jgi:hypothetical protein